MAKTADYKLGEYTFPRGWFMVSDASNVTAKPAGIRICGKDLVIYRGESGRVVLLDAYCPHMRTHLAKNTTSYVVKDGGHVEGDSIRCPYHAWRFGPDGKCNDIPYSNYIPAAARVKSWPVLERYGAVFLWHDPEEEEPNFDLPLISEWDDPAWVHWIFDDLGTMNTHPIEVIDNIADIAHQPVVHGCNIDCFENEIRGPIVWQRMGGAMRAMKALGDSDAGAAIDFNTYYTGPGLLISRFRGAFDTLMFICHTPVDDGVTRVWHGALVKSSRAVANEEDVAAAREFQALSLQAFSQDFEIWSSKEPCFQPMQLMTDGPFQKVRQWYKQFYNPRAQAAQYQKSVDGIFNVRGVAPAPVSSPRLQKLMA